MKELVKTIGDSKLYYNDDLGQFEIERFDEIISIGDVSLDEAIAEVEAIEE